MRGPTNEQLQAVEAEILRALETIHPSVDQGMRHLAGMIGRCLKALDGQGNNTGALVADCIRAMAEGHGAQVDIAVIAPEEDAPCDRPH
ncbi:hypothetical protein [Zavarzinia aquatilis]|uniref:Uncharacterized protein n=1 Tax=Zavarzinia aquatilis TaxID=2211142 RepID=A0A317EF83_9PROT|nr:hypothetical protein [Zavarzinia aquatilis]PWR24954.1 hypothetical protein DKG74_04080 [Zavarzinia aquatilis]